MKHILFSLFILLITSCKLFKYSDNENEKIKRYTDLVIRHLISSGCSDSTLLNHALVIDSFATMRPKSISLYESVGGRIEMPKVSAASYRRFIDLRNEGTCRVDYYTKKVLPTTEMCSIVFFSGLTKSSRKDRYVLTSDWFVSQRSGDTISTPEYQFEYIGYRMIQEFHVINEKILSVEYPVPFEEIEMIILHVK
jgi:hypothetical protein